MKFTDIINKIRNLQPKEIKRYYILGFIIVVLFLSLIRLAFSIDLNPSDGSKVLAENADEIDAESTIAKKKYHPIRSVPSYRNTFPDNNDVQLASARKYGVKPVQNRKDAETRMDELVYIESSPYFHVDPLTQSIPYLVPSAAALVQDIGKAFYDSLYVKGLPLHKIIVTSVLRTRDDVKKLKVYNVNATENSCHLYGTTVDICYNRYQSFSHVDGTSIRQVRNDTLKWVLSEVLRDFRKEKRCYIKYEVKQGCFHLTVNE